MVGFVGVSERNELRTQALVAQEEASAVTARLANVQVSLNLAEKRSKEQIEASSSLLLQNVGLIRELDEARLERETLLIELGRAQRGVENLNAQVENLSGQNDQFVDDLSKARFERRTLLSELSQARQQVSHLELQLSDIGSQNMDLEHELVEARRQLTAGFQKADALNRDMQAEQRQARREAAKVAEAGALATRRDKYCEAQKEKGVTPIESPELNRWGGRCCDGFWVKDATRICSNSF